MGTGIKSSSKGPVFFPARSHAAIDLQDPAPCCIVSWFLYIAGPVHRQFRASRLRAAKYGFSSMAAPDAVLPDGGAPVHRMACPFRSRHMLPAAAYVKHSCNGNQITFAKFHPR